MKLMDTVADAMARLDADLEKAQAVVTSAEARLDSARVALAELKVKKVGAEAFLAYLGEDVRREDQQVAFDGVTQGEDASERTVTQTLAQFDGSPSGLVEEVIRKSGLQKFSNETVNQLVAETGNHLTRMQVSNAITYLSRGNRPFLRSGGRRGQWELCALPDAESPAEAGLSDETSSPRTAEAWAG